MKPVKGEYHDNLPIPMVPGPVKVALEAYQINYDSAEIKLGAKAIDRRELENNEGYELKETQPVGS